MCSSWTVWAALGCALVLLWARHAPSRRTWGDTDVTLVRTARGVLVRRTRGLFLALLASALLVTAGSILRADPPLATVFVALGGATIGMHDIVRLSWASSNCLTWSNGVLLQALDARFRVDVPGIGAWEVDNLVLERVRTSVSSPAIVTSESGTIAVDGPLIEERVFVVLNAVTGGEPCRIHLALERASRPSSEVQRHGVSRVSFETEISRLLGMPFVEVKAHDKIAAPELTPNTGQVISRRGRHGFLSIVPAGPLLALACGAPFFILAGGLGVMFGFLPGELAIVGFVVAQASARRYVTYAAKHNFAAAIRLPNFVR